MSSRVPFWTSDCPHPPAILGCVRPCIDVFWYATLREQFAINLQPTNEVLIHARSRNLSALAQHRRSLTLHWHLDGGARRRGTLYLTQVKVSELGRPHQRRSAHQGGDMPLVFREQRALLQAIRVEPKTHIVLSYSTNLTGQASLVVMSQNTGLQIFCGSFITLWGKVACIS